MTKNYSKRHETLTDVVTNVENVSVYMYKNIM